LLAAIDLSGAVRKTFEAIGQGRAGRAVVGQFSGWRGSPVLFTLIEGIKGDGDEVIFREFLSI
jgi:hypothetical protein